MEPNPSKYPILNHLYRLPTFGSKPNSAFDIENPLPPPSSSQDTHQLSERMPHLHDPDVVKAMKLAVSDVSQTRSVLQGLGDRPNHETVDKALSKIAEIDAMLSHKIEQLVSAPKPQAVDPIKWQEEKEIEFKLEADKEKKIYKVIVNLDEMHQAYENLLADAENRLEKIYSSATLGKGKEVENEEEKEVNEEVIEILQKGEKELERVDLSMRKLRVLPEAFGRLSGLISLRLSGNELKTLPDSVGGIENLEELYLSSNLLESLPDSIGLLVKLKILDVASNKLKALPDSISHCRSLEELDASYNSLMYLPTNIGYELGNLVKLSVHYNKLRSLPSSICEMRSLRYLDAHFNELQGLPYAIGRLTSLEILNLSSNFSDLEELPETFGDLINLKELDLSNNQIHVLPNTFGRLDKLTKLNLDQNPIFLPPVEVVNKGVEAVKEFMAKRWLDILVEEELNYRAEADNQAQAGWLKRSTTLLTRSTSALGNWASTVSESVSEYLGGNSPRESYLNQQL